MEWIIPCNPNKYDVVTAFSNLQTIDWKQSNNIVQGDIIYIYVGKPFQQILFKTLAIRCNISFKEVNSDDNIYNIGTFLTDRPVNRFMRLQLLESFSSDYFGIDKLMEHGLSTPPQGAMLVKNELFKYLHSYPNNKHITIFDLESPITAYINNENYYLSLWTSFKCYLVNQQKLKAAFPLYKPSSHNWYDVYFETMNYHIVLRNSIQKRSATIEFYIKEDKSFFDILFSNKDYIESIIQNKLLWRRKSENKASIISLILPLNSFSNYNEYFRWMAQMSEKIYNLMSYIINSSKNTFPDSADTESCIEGAKLTVQVNKFERSSVARQKCIDINGCFCHICGLRFEERYGEIGKDFIHVHHKIPLNEINEEYIVDPVHDLIPVCPNCHAMLHRKINGKYLSIEELKSILK